MNDSIVKPEHKTGHILVHRDFKCSFEEAGKKDFWQEMVNNGSAVFYRNAFNVETFESKDRTLVKSVYKQDVFESQILSGAVIEFYSSAVLEGLSLEQGVLRGFPTNFHQILPWESQTENTSRQRQIIFEIEPKSENNIVRYGDLDFDPNYEIKHLK